jgi:hypothetical protein
VGKNYRPGERVHDRLYKHAIQKSAEQHNALVSVMHEYYYAFSMSSNVYCNFKQVDLMQNKLKVSLKPWEIARASQVQANLGSTANLLAPNLEGSQAVSKLYSRTHLPKAPLSDFVEEMVLDEEVRVFERRGGEIVSGGGGEGGLSVQDLQGERVKTSKQGLTIVEFDDSLGNLWRQLRIM